jgi:hypothetical protein
MPVPRNYNEGTDVAKFVKVGKVTASEEQFRTQVNNSLKKRLPPQFCSAGKQPAKHWN